MSEYSLSVFSLKNSREANVLKLTDFDEDKLHHLVDLGSVVKNFFNKTNYLMDNCRGATGEAAAHHLNEHSKSTQVDIFVIV